MRISVFNFVSIAKPQKFEEKKKTHTQTTRVMGKSRDSALPSKYYEMN